MHTNGRTGDYNIYGKLSCVELCAGGGGQSIGLEMTGFSPEILIDNDERSIETLRLNRPGWNSKNISIRDFDGTEYKGIDLLSGGLPCPPFSVAGKQLGMDDDRDLFPEALRIVAESSPRAVMIENVRGLLSPTFDEYREQIKRRFKSLGYQTSWNLLNAADFGVSQTRKRVVIVAMRPSDMQHFSWPEPYPGKPHSVGELLFDLMAENDWTGADWWRSQANRIAPTIVGGSKKHGGPDLGPTRSKQAWSALCVDGRGIANAAPDKNFTGKPRLTVKMTARIQGIPDEWEFAGKKTAAYRQVGNAFPPALAHVVSKKIFHALHQPNVRFEKGLSLVESV